MGKGRDRKLIPGKACSRSVKIYKSGRTVAVLLRSNVQSPLNHGELCHTQATLRKLRLLLCLEHVGYHSTRISWLGERDSERWFDYSLNDT